MEPEKRRSAVPGCLTLIALYLFSQYILITLIAHYFGGN